MEQMLLWSQVQDQLTQLKQVLDQQVNILALLDHGCACASSLSYSEEFLTESQGMCRYIPRRNS